MKDFMKVLNAKYTVTASGACLLGILAGVLGGVFNSAPLFLVSVLLLAYDLYKDK